MMEFLQDLQAWHWLCFGIFILLGELLGAGGFLLGIGASAILVALLKFVLPDLTWYWQFLIFGVMSVFLTLLYWKRFKNFNEKTEQPLLNSRIKNLIGRQTPLIKAIESGQGKVQIEDALWTVACTQNLPIGAIVKVTGAEGMVLLVEPIE
ncbi:MAG: NfeD family protein [Cellvibrio sp.]|nr:NfeD family protein [Cellvibrio sp.]